MLARRAIGGRHGTNVETEDRRGQHTPELLIELLANAGHWDRLRVLMVDSLEGSEEVRS